MAKHSWNKRNGRLLAPDTPTLGNSLALRMIAFEAPCAGTGLRNLIGGECNEDRRGLAKPTRREMGR